MSKERKQKSDSVTLVLNAQVIVTGIPVSQEEAKKIIEFIKGHSIDNWCHQDGKIGHIDSVKITTTFERMCNEFHEVASAFPMLEIAITFMNGKAGSYNMPLISYVMKHGQIRKDDTGTAHMGHPPPRRATSADTNRKLII